MISDDTSNYFVRKFRGVWHSSTCVFLYKLFLLVQHLTLCWIAEYYGYRTLVVGIVLFGIPAILSEIKFLLKIHIVILLTVAALLVFFLYTGMIDTTIAEAKNMYTKAFKKPKNLNNPYAMKYVM